MSESTNENSTLLSVSPSRAPQEHEEHEENGTKNKEVITQEARALENYLKFSGFGVFHVFLLLVSGLATAADAVEIFGVSFVVPIAEGDLNLSTGDKGWLDASIFIGMLIGGYTWGSLADVFGRKRTLMSAMLFNGICGLVSSLSPNFLFFLFFRLMSGIGVGGSQPIVFSYVSEFFTEKQRGPMIIILASCWQPGIIFTALLAWGLMGIQGPDQSVNFYIGSLHFVNWRLFLIICTLPALLSAVSLSVMPESPAYLLHVKQIKQLEKVLRKIQHVNMMCRCCLIKVEGDETVSLMDRDDLDLLLSESEENSPSDETSSLDASSPISLQSRVCKHLHFFRTKLKKIMSGTFQLFKHQYIRATSLLLIIWFTQSLGYYGLQLWFPEYFKRLREETCELQTTSIDAPICANATDLQYYQDTLYTAIASLPGNIAGALLINIIGGKVQLVGAMMLSTLSVFLIWRVPSTNGAVLGVSCAFSAVTVTVFGSLDVILMNIYDVQVRSTAFGVHSGIGRIGAILGNVLFGHLLDVNRAIPIVIIASSLLLGGLAAVFLPPVYRPENQPPLVRLYQIVKTRLMSTLTTRTDKCDTASDSVAPDTADHEDSCVESNV